MWLSSAILIAMPRVLHVGTGKCGSATRKLAQLVYHARPLARSNGPYVVVHSRLDPDPRLAALWPSTVPTHAVRRGFRMLGGVCSRPVIDPELCRCLLAACSAMSFREAGQIISPKAAGSRAVGVLIICSRVADPHRQRSPRHRARKPLSHGLDFTIACSPSLYRARGGFRRRRSLSLRQQQIR